MTDNPYAAPQVASHTVDVFEHIKAIRKVAKIFRVLGWIGIAIFAPLSAISIPAAAWYFFNPQEAPRAFTLEHDYARAVEEMHRGMIMAIACLSPLLAYASWGFLRTAKGLLKKSPFARIGAIVYSWLFLFEFPVFTWLGMICLTNLRRHWQLFCLQAPDDADAGEST